MDLKISVSLNRFESLSQTAEEKMIGGFSASFSSAPAEDVGDGGSNNCDGGNCKTGCGSGQNISCNTVAGCGKLY